MGKPGNVSFAILYDARIRNHTPGPWTGGNSRVWGGAFEICEVKNGMGTPTACANARLIAAAPDLLGLLEEALFELREQYLEAGVLGEEKSDWITARMEAEIRKAKGE